MVPAGCTSLIQPLDVCINKLLKDRIRALADQHYIDHILEWSAQKYNASERMAQWVGQAWESIQRSFRKCGVAVAIDGSEDHENSPMPPSTTMDTLDTSGSDSDSNECTTSSSSGIFGAEIMD